MSLLQATCSKLGGAVAVKDRELDTAARAVHFCATAPERKQVSMHQSDCSHQASDKCTQPCTNIQCLLHALSRELAAARDSEVKAAVAHLAKIAAVSEMQLQTLRLQAEGNRIGQLGVASNGIMGNCSTAHGNFHSWYALAHFSCTKQQHQLPYRQLVLHTTQRLQMGQTYA